MGYFAPPSHETWRLVDAASTADSLTLDWLPPDALATTWKVAVRSVVAKRRQSGAAEIREAIALGLIPPLDDGELVIDAKAELRGNWLFACRAFGSHAYPDSTLVLRLRLDGDLLVGIACRTRPPCTEEDTRDLITWLASAIEERTDDPIPAALDPSRSAEHRAFVDPALRELDDAQEHDDYERAARALLTLGPFLIHAPLSRFALNLHLAQGWIQKRRAFEGEPGAATRAIDAFRDVMISIDDRHRDLLRLASRWLGQVYSLRDQAGDLRRAILAYERVLSLEEEPGSGRSADVHFRAGVLHRAMAERLRETPAAAADEVRLAIAHFDHADRICDATGAMKGRIETAVAAGDCLRLAGGEAGRARAADRYGEAFRWLTEPGGQDAVGVARFEQLLQHLFLCMRALDALQFGDARREGDEARAKGIFLRPLNLTRKLMVDGISLELALGRSLGPDVSLFYMGGGLHPGAATMGSAVSEGADWRLPVQTELREREIILLVPGSTPGMQWELRYLHEEGLLDRTLLMMLPAALYAEAPALWQGSAAAAFEYGLGLPAYSAAGAVLRVTRDGRVTNQLPFEVVSEPGGLRRAVADLVR